MDAARNYGTQLFDEVERVTDAYRKSRAALMAMPSAGFKRGSRVPRVIGAKTDSVREFNVYAPRVLASISRLSTTVADRSFRIELVRKCRHERLIKFSPRLQANALAWLRDDLHLVALQHAQEIAAFYDRAEEFPIPDQVDDRLRDILEPLFAIAIVADTEKGIGFHVDAMVRAARALVGIRVEHDTDAALVAALTALEGMCEPNNRGVVIPANGALALFQTVENLGWVDTEDKARGLLRRLGFCSAIHRRDRFWEEDRPDPGRETARGYEIKLAPVHDLLTRYSTDAEPSQVSHPNGQNDFAHQSIRNSDPL
jgi:Protein of unknown function (DUF3631)